MDKQDLQFLLDHFQDVQQEQAQVKQQLEEAMKLLPKVTLDEDFKYYTAVGSIKDLLIRNNTAQNRILGALSLIDMRLENVINESE